MLFCYRTTSVIHMTTPHTEIKPKYDNISLSLLGYKSDGSIIAEIVYLLRSNGVSADEIAEFRTEATSDDYYTFLRTVLAWVRVSEFASDDIACLEEGDDPEEWKNRHCCWCEELHENCDCE